MASGFRVLLPQGRDATDLAALYAVPQRPWLRANMVSTLDGAASGGDGRTASINNEADTEVFHLLRTQADAIIVGAGTVRAENYRPTDRPLVVVTRTGSVPPSLQEASGGSVLIATSGTAPGLATTRAELGDENVLVVGDEVVDLARLRSTLFDRGLLSLLCEGGPGLLRDALAARVVDELCLTWVPSLFAGDPHRLLAGEPIEAALTLTLLIEHRSTLLGRWVLGRD